MTAKPLPRFIVAEVSKNWDEGVELGPLLLSERFEVILNTNHARGYRLLQFALHRMMTNPGEMNETLVAVFEQVT